MIPTRTFSADEDDFSRGNAGPDAIEKTFDDILAVLNGNIEAENLKNASVTEEKLASVTLDQELAAADTGNPIRLLGGIVNVIRALKGVSDWKDPAATSLAYLLNNKSDVGHSHGNPTDGHTHDEFRALDILGVSRQIVTGMTITRDADKKITRMDYITSEDSGWIKFHRDTLGRLDCARFSADTGTHTIEVQVELIRGSDGLISHIYRSGFNATLQSGLTWPINEEEVSPDDPPVIEDSFDRPDGPLGTTDTGQEWEILSGSWSVINGKAAPTAANGQAVVNKSQSLYLVQVKVDAIGAYPGIVTRASDAQNYILFYWDSDEYCFTIAKIENSSQNSLVYSDYTELLPGDVIKLVVNGTSLTGYHNGTIVCSVTSDFNLTATKHGLDAGGSTDTRYDDFATVSM